MRSPAFVRSATIVVCVVLIVGALAHLCATAGARAELRAARCAIAAAGAPSTIAEVRPPVPPADDATEAWYRVVSLIHDRPISGDAFDRGAPSPRAAKVRREFAVGNAGALPIHAEPAKWTTEERAAVVALCDDHPELWDALTAATDRARCRFPLRYQDGPGCPMPDIAWLRGAMNLARLRVALDCDRGAWADACAWSARTLRMADHIDDDAMLLAHLVAIGIRQSALTAIAPRLGAIDDDAALRRLADAVAAVDERRCLRVAVDGERVVLGDLLGEPERIAALGGGGGRLSAIGWRAYCSGLGEPMRVHDHACHLRALLDARDGVVASPPLLGPVTRRLLAELALQCRLDEMLARRVDVAVAAIAARRCRLVTGAWPVSLDDLAPYLARAPRATSGLRLAVVPGGGATLSAEVPNASARTAAERAKDATALTIVLAP